MTHIDPECNDLTPEIVQIFEHEPTPEQLEVGGAEASEHDILIRLVEGLT